MAFGRKVNVGLRTERDIPAWLLMPAGVVTCVIHSAIHAGFAKSRYNTYGTSARTRAR